MVLLRSSSLLYSRYRNRVEFKEICVYEIAYPFHVDIETEWNLKDFSVLFLIRRHE